MVISTQNFHVRWKESHWNCLFKTHNYKTGQNVWSNYSQTLDNRQRGSAILEKGYTSGEPHSSLGFWLRRTFLTMVQGMEPEQSMAVSLGWGGRDLSLRLWQWVAFQGQSPWDEEAHRGRDGRHRCLHGVSLGVVSYYCTCAKGDSTRLSNEQLLWDRELNEYQSLCFWKMLEFWPITEWKDLVEHLGHLVKTQKGNTSKICPTP